MARRSVLFTPGDRPEMLRKAPKSGADVIVFDLEDGVSPDRKQQAREGVVDALSDPRFDPDCEVCVRTNAEPELRDADLEALVDSGQLTLDGLMLPKTASASDVQSVVDRLEEYATTVPIFALIESASGVLEAPKIARVPETTALVFGAEDLSADIGATRTSAGTEVLYARERIVLAAAAADIDAIDTVFTDFEDESGLRTETSFAIQLGYDGKLAIHPAQIEPINEAFVPEPADLEWARDVLAAKREADDIDRGAFEVDGEMIDAPLVAQANRILERAELEDGEY
ncbi:CoA ester lyase [Halostagnicola sp. A-GB9-2]|uniref:HpcH/HpaI aldolase/citrate lyase family protein n=1 Tax=Halostagnicola sp. A-GB9-2 TaxID=3048066 RepID=UPI0024BF957C|nr:CoA ester lyase [Halostagnicola sp. A-GB9-2]MDJ1430623.1 CoA ester lyase [Halostagnicola sp. A-GB9-2]